MSLLGTSLPLTEMSDENSTFGSVGGSSDGWEFNRQHPHSFLCPISRQCMHDPVVLSDGHTYERRHIEQWLQKHNTSPVSGTELHAGNMFPNHALRNGIEEYFEQIFSVHRTAIRRSVAGPLKPSSCDSNAALVRTVDSLMQCSLVVNEDLSVECILRRIMDEAKTLVGAEVASVFLADHHSQELYSNVNSTGKEIRIPISAGIAGHVATTGESVVIQDAYSDERFNKTVDLKTGFKTRNILCVPIKTKKGGIIGVTQLINKTNTGVFVTAQSDSELDDAQTDIAFTADDEQFLQLFASQAAAAIATTGVVVVETPVVQKDLPQVAEPIVPSAAFEDSGARTQVRHNVRRKAQSFRRCGKAKVKAKFASTGSSNDPTPYDRETDSEPLSTLLQTAFCTWEMDAFSLSELTDNKPLSTLGCYLFEQLGLVESFNIDCEKLFAFFDEIEHGYDDGSRISYHNRTHAASVMHAMHAVLKHGRVSEALAQADGISSSAANHERAVRLNTMACLLAAAVHDVEHKGLSNDFLIKTDDERAVRYNDQHVNESHHAATAFAVLSRPEANFLEQLPANEYTELRRLVVQLILATDMADNGHLLTAFKDAIGDVNAGSSEGMCDWSPDSLQSSTLAMQMALKCADLGHLALRWEQHVKWVSLLEAEFFAQGDKEKARQISPISFLMDREKPGVSQSQAGFFEFVVLPLFSTLARAFPATSPMLALVKANNTAWLELAAAEKTKQDACMESLPNGGPSMLASPDACSDEVELDSAALSQLLCTASNTWELDAFALARLTNNKPLSTLGRFLFDHLGITECFKIDCAKLTRFLSEIEEGYDDGAQIPYHNRIHATSVLHAMYALMTHGEIGRAVSNVHCVKEGHSDPDHERRRQLDTMACLLGAAVHDYEHKGLSNDFLIRTKDDRAVRYNDQHVNENHHVAATFGVLRRPEYNFLEHLKVDEYHYLRRVVIDLVLATDMADNGKLLSSFNDAIGAGASCVGTFVPTSTQDAKLAMQMAMKCADLGHLALSWDQHIKWVQLLEQEFFKQGDAEKELGQQPVSFLMDRDKPGVSQTQKGFFEFVVLPLFGSLHQAFPATSPMLAHVKANYEAWLCMEFAPTSA